MRFPRIAILSLIGALALAPHPGTAQVTATVQLGQPRYEVRVSPYAADVYGDWRTNYRRWRPVNLYSVDGHYYSRAVPGSRAVSVYRWQNEYFLPPRDRQFDNMDRRYNYDRRPVDGDYNIVEGLASLFGGRPERGWGNEVFISSYSPDVHGDWRNTYRRWQPVTLYNRNGRYFTRDVPSARAVMVYRWQNQYFLPPTDDQWRSADRRYNYGRAPTQDDYNNPQRFPGRYGQQQPGQPGQEPGQYGQPPSRAYGNDVAVTIYSPQTHGDWRSAYNQWETATLYNLNGRYSLSQVPGARPLMVYRSQNQYFLPPRDQAWDNMDRRYDYRLRPTDDDYNTIQRQPRRP